MSPLVVGRVLLVAACLVSSLPHRSIRRPLMSSLLLSKSEQTSRNGPDAPQAVSLSSQSSSSQSSSSSSSFALDTLVQTAKALYREELQSRSNNNNNSNNNTLPFYTTVAPGRVNLIGEHTDYTGGFVLPLAIHYSTVVFGTGRLRRVVSALEDNDTTTKTTMTASTDKNKPSTTTTTARLVFVSAMSPNHVHEIHLTADSQPPAAANHNNHNESSSSSSSSSSSPSWTNYVVGVVAQYLPDLVFANNNDKPSSSSSSLQQPQQQQQCAVFLDLTFAIAGNVPLGAGLSSSASLEVAVARFVECFLGPAAFSSQRLLLHHDDNDDGRQDEQQDQGEDEEQQQQPSLSLQQQQQQQQHVPKWRALRCQRAEHEWCHSPCGIMDQYVSSAAQDQSLLCIDCRSLDYELVQLCRTTSSSSSSSTVPDDNNNNNMTTTTTTTTPSLVVCNSRVQHSIASGEYPVRVAQCQEATRLLQEYAARTSSSEEEHQDGIQVESLRDATLELVEQAHTNGMDNVITRRARHVVTENTRTLQAKDALIVGDWEKVGKLMNQSHASMRDDYEVSCEEVDILVDLAQGFPGVYGSRLTGGGFGGCTVTLVQPDRVEQLMEHLKHEYKRKTGLDCVCFETSPAAGARVLEG